MEKPLLDYPLEDGQICLSHKDGRYYIALDRDAAVIFLFSLHWLITDQPIGEEISLWSCDCGKLPCLGDEVGYCEINFIPEHDSISTNNEAKEKSYGIYNAKIDRLDYYVDLTECRVAYDALLALLSDIEDRREIRELAISDTLTLRLVNDG